jgi:hypothetical protein
VWLTASCIVWQSWQNSSPSGGLIVLPFLVLHPLTHLLSEIRFHSLEDFHAQLLVSVLKFPVEIVSSATKLLVPLLKCVWRVNVGKLSSQVLLLQSGVS